MDPLDSLVLLAEQERLLFDSARRVYMHHYPSQYSNHQYTSPPTYYQKSIGELQHYVHASKEKPSFATTLIPLKIKKHISEHEAVSTANARRFDRHEDKSILDSQHHGNLQLPSSSIQHYQDILNDVQKCEHEAKESQFKHDDLVPDTDSDSAQRLRVHHQNIHQLSSTHMRRQQPQINEVQYHKYAAKISSRAPAAAFGTEEPRFVSTSLLDYKSITNEIENQGQTSRETSPSNTPPMQQESNIYLEESDQNEIIAMRNIQKHEKSLPTTITGEEYAALPTTTSSTHRKMGRIRYFDELLGSYGPWIDIVGGNESTITLDLSRGGTLRILCNILPITKRNDLSKAMHDCKLYRQYSLCRNDRLNFAGFHEPRSHVLLSSRTQCVSDDDASSQPGYIYHGIKMKALPISLVPEVASYAEELAEKYNLQHWDIGVDMIIYKDGNDSIGWHSDDTQGETVVLCVVVEAPGEVRPLYIRPNKKVRPLRKGDEEIQLFIAEGDGYDMDGFMQQHYEHSLPKKTKNNSHRLVLIFRQGSASLVPKDSGVSIIDEDLCKGKEWNVVSAITKLRPKTDTVMFGHPMNVFVGECYARRYLWSTFAHRADQRGINGNIKDGSDSIVVSRQDFAVREEDGLSWLRYTSSRRQGGGALCKSYQTKKPVRVFRSSNLRSPYRPEAFEGGRTSYRYDGLYLVTHIWNSEGFPTEKDIPVGNHGVQYTFHLERLESQNLMTIGDLFWKIQQSHCYGPHLPFMVPRPKNDCFFLPGLILGPKTLEKAEPILSQYNKSSQSTFEQPFSINHSAAADIKRYMTSKIVQELKDLVTKSQIDSSTKGTIKMADMGRQKNQSRSELDQTRTQERKDAALVATKKKKTQRPVNYAVNESVYAYDKPPKGNILYEGKVIKVKEDSDGGLKYLVHYKGYSKSQDNWLLSKEIMKQTKTNDAKFLKSRSSSSLRPKSYEVKKTERKDMNKDMNKAIVCKPTKKRKRCLDQGETVNEMSKRTCSSGRAQTFGVSEKIFAYDKNKSGDVLYEAEVISVKEDAAGVKCYIQYKGYKKRHNKWLGAEELLKETKSNRIKFEKSRM